jgi:hypothetical protein
MLIVQLISGFTQTEENWNGTQELREKLLAELDDYSSLSVRIRLDVWNAHWKAIARQVYMLRERYPQEPFVVVAFAYSWGVGNGLVKFAKYLDRFGIDIAHAVTADGVYRHWFSLGNWRALWGNARIAIPRNVLKIEGYYQETNRPRGLRPMGDTTTCDPWTLLRLPHAEMDDARPWRQRCIEVAKQYAALAVGSPKNVPATAPKAAALDAMDRVPVVNGNREGKP